MAPIVYAIASASIVFAAAVFLGTGVAVVTATACIVYNIRSVEEAARQSENDREAEK